MAKTVISDELRVNLYQHIIGHNKHMTKEYLDTLTPKKLLSEVHPTYLDWYTKLIFPITHAN